MKEQKIREIVREELSNERVGAAETTPIGLVTKELITLFKHHKLTYREATLIFRDARSKIWPSIERRD